MIERDLKDTALLLRLEVCVVAMGHRFFLRFLRNRNKINILYLFEMRGLCENK